MSQPASGSHFHNDLDSLCLGSHEFLVSEDLDALIVQPTGGEEYSDNVLVIARGQTLDDALRTNQATDGFVVVWEELSDDEKNRVRLFWNNVTRERGLWSQAGDVLAQSAGLILVLEVYAVIRHGWAAWTDWVEFEFVVLWVPAAVILSYVLVRFFAWLIEGLFKRLLRVPEFFDWSTVGVLIVILGVSFAELIRRATLTGELSMGLALMKAVHDTGVIIAAVIVTKVFQGAWHYARILIR